MNTLSIDIAERSYPSPESAEVVSHQQENKLVRPEPHRPITGSELRPLIPKKRVLEMLGKSNGWLYNKLNPSSKYYDPTFPRQIRLSKSGTAVVWVLQELVDWIEQQIERSRAEDATFTRSKESAQ